MDSPDRPRMVMLLVAALVAVLAIGSLAAGWIGPDATDDHQIDADRTDVSVAVTVPLVDAPVAGDQEESDLVVVEPVAETCVLTVTSVRRDDTGDDVRCVQLALVELGYLDGGADAVFDESTYRAVVAMQTDEGLFVDGVVGRETGLALGVWPDESLTVIRTRTPSPDAVDGLGYPLSSVASAGADAPALPANSGSGRRLVYERAGQRIWAVSDDETVIRSWLVSGSKYDNEVPGTHQVYSRSEMSTAWNGQARLPMMVRWLKTDIGAIGFHALPTRIDDGSPYQTEAELGTRLSGGCQRQADLDARFVWDFAQIGTPVVVL